MKSIKPGRGPSMMGGIMGIFMICFGVFWTVIAAANFGPFALFGVFWTCMAIAMTVYNFKNAKSKNRYSSFDITEDGEEPDPLNERFGRPSTDYESYRQYEQDNKFCPYCGKAVKDDFEFCNNCGKKLP